MGEIMLITSLLMATALAASLLAGRMRIPALLLFLGIGMAVGTDGLGWIHFEDYELARDVGIVALALILYEGGLTTHVGELRRVAVPAAALAVLGTLLTAMLTGLAATWLLGLPLLHGLLLGSIIASTDVAAVFALLRGSGLPPRLTRLLEGEAGSNDPVAILLVIGFIDWIEQPGYGAADMAGLFASQLGIGAGIGVGVGWLATEVIRRVELPTVGLYPVASLTAGGLAFGAADVLGGSGFLAIYLTGLALSSATIPARRTITAFHGGVAWVAQLTLFLVLGLLVFPSHLGEVALEGALLALILMLIARPVAVTLSAFTPIPLPERVVLAWAGLRGAVPVVLATFPVIAGIPDSLDFFNIVFFAVVLSLLVQGTTFEPLARRLKLTTAAPPLPEPLAEIGSIRQLGAEIVEYPVTGDHAIAGVRVRDLGLPREAVVNVIVRDKEAIPPRGSTRVRPGDRLHILIRREVAREVRALMKRWRHGPVGRRPRPRRIVHGTSPIFVVRPWDPAAITGPIGAPEAVMGQGVVARLRSRQDEPGAVVALDDGRYGITGALLVVGSRNDVTSYVRRRIRYCDEEERAWLQTVVGALAVDAFE